MGESFAGYIDSTLGFGLTNAWWTDLPYGAWPTAREWIIRFLRSAGDRWDSDAARAEGEELPQAFVVPPSRGRPSADQVIDYVAQRVAPYKKVRRVEFIEASCRSAPGKVLRNELRARDSDHGTVTRWVPLWAQLARMAILLAAPQVPWKLWSSRCRAPNGLADVVIETLLRPMGFGLPERGVVLSGPSRSLSSSEQVAQLLRVDACVPQNPG